MVKVVNMERSIKTQEIKEISRNTNLISIEERKSDGSRKRHRLFASTTG